MIVENIYNTLWSTLNLNQWKNTKPAIKLFQEIPNKNSLIQVDIKKNCPSITEELRKVLDLVQ